MEKKRDLKQIEKRIKLAQKMEQKLGNPEEEEYESANEKEGEEITGFSFILAKLAEDKEPLKN